MPNASERRRATRVPCSLRAIIYASHNPPCNGHVFDRSDLGLGLETARWFEPGSWVSIDLPDIGCELVTVQVARVKSESGAWVVGCVFGDS